MPLGTKASTVHCFAQDSLGMLWLGSNNGLYSYDGYALHAPTVQAANYQTFIYAIAVLDARYMALGTGNGVTLYNYQEDRYEDFPVGGPADVRALLLLGDKLWIGSLTGLFCFDTKRKTWVDYHKTANKKISSQAIYALSGQGDTLLMGTYNGLFRLTASSGELLPLPLPGYRVGSNQFVNSILPMPSTHSAFIGTEYGLYMYDTHTGLLAKAPVLQQHPIKSMALKDGRTLLIGSDDGLFVYRPAEKSLDRIKHDSRNSHALANNIVWSIFKDQSENIWLGTDLGFSLWSKQQTEKRYPIYQFTNSADGNRFYKITKDRDGWYWLGGDNGLIRTRRLGSKDFQSHWYRMDAVDYPLAHNRIRDVYEDRDGMLWVASDGGVNLFNSQSRQFRGFTIIDVSGTRNAKWAYDMFEDVQGNLWVATYMGGIFMLEKEQLLASRGSFVAGTNYNRTNGLLADFANQLLDDGQGNIWALFYNRGISRINRHRNQVSELKDKDGQSLAEATFMLKDEQGTVWIGEHGALRRIRRNGTMLRMQFDPVGRSEVTAMVEVGQSIWVATSVGVWRVDKAQLTAELLHYGQEITSMYYDKQQQEVLLGGINEIMVLNDRPLLSYATSAKKIVLTAMYVNNEAFGNDNYGLRYRNELTLSHQQNNLRLEFSDLDYGNHLGYRLAYAFKGRNETWIPLERGDNKVLLSNLAPGNYELQLAKVDFAGQVISQIDNYKIHIQYPWYASWWAKMCYALAALGLLFWGINFFRVRNTLKWERRERHKVLELTRMKMDFLTAISHELKTPLSLILAPVSQLLLHTKSADKKRQLEGVHRNALKINNLIQEVMAFDKAEKQEANTINLLTSQIDLLAFVKQAAEEWQQSPVCATLQLRFVAAIDSLYIQTDVSKLTSILNNLLSNACKYNLGDQGRVDISLEQRDERVILTVRDTGMGIAEEDLPYVYSKFYRSSSKAVSAVEGTGVGLYLVKSYCDQLGWDIQIHSVLGQGTTVSIAIDSTNRLQPFVTEPEAGNKRKLLIVEDNSELASFLKEALDTTYACQVVANGREGLQVLNGRSFLPDIIISDAMMPVMGGLEMVKKMRQNTGTATIPVILLTAKNHEQMQRDWVAAGIDAFIAKPFDLEVLKMQLLQLLDKRDKLAAQLRLDQISKPVLGPQKESPDEKFLAKVTLLIEENIDDAEFSVQRLSEQADMAAKQLYRKIKQLTGYTPVEYIRNIRMKKAALLLQQKKFTVAEVMYMVGYTNASYFSKCFQAAFGMTPKGYMDKNI